MRSEVPADVAIAFDHVSKHYSLSLQKEATDFKTALLHLPRFISGARRPFVALDDVTLRVRRGESLGIIGPNGSGKSTTLRIMARIAPPTSGTVTVNGRVSALLELGSGFHPQISGRENAILNAVLLGLTLQEARDVLPAVIEFSELGDFIDQPMRTYSSGMFFRLGFSVAVHVKPEILLIDEVLAVGDAEFQKKCMDHIHGLRKQGVTLVLVTHDMMSLPMFCDRGILIEHGRITDEGTPQQVVHNYLARVERLLALREEEREQLKIAQAVPS
ncbi:MAG TPA: ABC transporter ATP-binding protein [Dehalococcoidia bacterium]|nr:ABC transporter ATP-binding protein [Dehalococcoidia bacterium]